jgi:hypothetical protein
MSLANTTDTTFLDGKAIKTFLWPAVRAGKALQQELQGGTMVTTRDSRLTTEEWARWDKAEDTGARKEALAAPGKQLTWLNGRIQYYKNPATLDTVVERRAETEQMRHDLVRVLRMMRNRIRGERLDVGVEQDGTL